MNEKGRLYLVRENGGNEKIVEASSQAQAIKIVVGERFKAEAASARDVARVMAQEYGSKPSLQLPLVGEAS